MTEMLWLKDSYMKEFDAVVQSVAQGKFVVLDKCVFYTQGGGQPSDTGFLEKNGKGMRVVFSKKTGNDVSLEVEACDLKEGDRIKGILDWDKRYKLMRMHTASHMLSAVIFNETGSLITGNQLGEEKSRMDFNIEEFDRSLLLSLEEKGNQAVKDAIDVTVSFMPTEEAFKNEKLFRLKDVLPPGLKELRIVQIGELDIQADGGTHVKNTSEVGKIKITKLENKGANNRRIYFTLED